MTTLTPEEFDEFYADVKKELIQMKRDACGPDRQRKLGAGRTPEFCLRDRLSMTLMIMQGMSEQVVGAVYDTGHDTALRAFREILPILLKLRDVPERLQSKAHRSRNYDLRTWMEEGKKGVAIDGCVQETTKPPTKDQYKKHARHGKGVGFNFMLTAKLDGQIADVSKAVPASCSDITLYRKHKNTPLLLQAAFRITDLGFIGAEAKDSDTPLTHGDKRRPGKQLSPESREKNRRINAQRYIVEQLNSFIKNFKMLRKMHWYDREGFNDLLAAICGIINFRWRHRQTKPVDWGHKNRQKKSTPGRQCTLPV